MIAQTFNLPLINIDEILFKSRPNSAVSNKMISLYGDVRGVMWARTSPIFGAVPVEREESWSLKFVLITTLVLFAAEIFIMFHKNHFFNLLVYTLILLIYIQNYFDKLYMRITIFAVVLAIVFDFLWLSVQAEVIILIYLELVESIRLNSTLKRPDWLFEIQLFIGYFHNVRKNLSFGFHVQIP